MKQFISTFFMVGIAFVTSAQVKQGKIIYERTSETQMNSRMAGSKDFEQTTIKDTRNYQLLFANNESVFEILPDVNALAENEGGQNRVIRMGGSPGVFYANLAKNLTVEANEFNGQNLLIQGSIEKLNWKKTGETKTILGYKAYKAVAPNITTNTRPSMENGVMKLVEVTDTLQVEAWYTPEIPVAVGPDFQGQLEGAILELKTDNGRDVFRAVEVSKKVDVADIKEPRKGKKITTEEFREERRKANEQMSERLKNRGRQ